MSSESAGAAVGPLDIRRVMAALPHRYPFLLIDRIEELVPKKRIVAIWQEILKVPAVGAEDNFFDLGGHSLLAVQVHSRVRALGVRDVSITDLFRFPTVRALAAFLGEPAQVDVAAKAGTDRAEARRQALLRRQQALR